MQISYLWIWILPINSVFLDVHSVTFIRYYKSDNSEWGSKSQSCTVRGIKEKYSRQGMLMFKICNLQRELVKRDK
jgi:hypothetical protein